MSEKATVARPYAKAAFEIAREHNELAQWTEVLAAAAATVSEPRVERLLSNPRVTPQDLTALITDICGPALSERSRNFIATLANNRRLALLPVIAQQFEQMRAEAENVADVHVTSAVPLNEWQSTRLKQALEKRLKRQVRMHTSVDASLIGGAIVRSGDMVIDGSVRARLERMGYQLTH